MKEKAFLLWNLIGVDTLILIIIACCMFFLNSYTVTKLNEMQNARNDAVFTKGDITFEDEEQFATEIINYLPDTYKMIELYDENLDIGFQMQFNDGNIPKDDITKYPQLVDILRNNEEGQTRVVIRGVDQDIYFKWLTTNNDERRLLMIYSAVPQITGLWVFSFVCYAVLILVCILFVRLRFKSFKDNIARYNLSTKRIRDEIRCI